MSSKEPKDFDTFPNSDKFNGKQIDCMTRTATLICSAYAYHRGILPPDAFYFVRVSDSKNNPMFSTAHPKAKQNLAAIRSLQSELSDKKLAQFTFAVCRSNYAETIIEALRFDFDYGEAAVNIMLPNATNVRVTTKWDYAVDLKKVLQRVRLISSYLEPLPDDIQSLIILKYFKKPLELPKDFHYHNKYDLEQIDVLPVARFSYKDVDTTMTVEIRSKYFVDVNNVRKDVERGLDVQDDKTDSEDSTLHSDEGEVKKRDDDSDDDDDDDDGGDSVQVVGDSLEEEKPRNEPRHSPDDFDHAGSEHSTLLSDEAGQVKKPRNDPQHPLNDDEDNQMLQAGARKRSLSATALVVASMRSEPEPKKACHFSCYNYAPLDGLKISYEYLNE